MMLATADFNGIQTGTDNAAIPYGIELFMKLSIRCYLSKSLITPPCDKYAAHNRTIATLTGIDIDWQNVNYRTLDMERAFGILASSLRRKRAAIFAWNISIFVSSACHCSS